MSKVTVLTEGTVHLSNDLLITLVEPDNEPARVVISWPQHATVTTPAKLNEVVAAACRILASASTELSRIKSGRNKRRPS
jgi:hypothetical protein